MDLHDQVEVMFELETHPLAIKIIIQTIERLQSIGGSMLVKQKPNFRKAAESRSDRSARN